MRRSKLLLLVLVLLLLNAAVFLFRDRFAYQPWAGRNELYGKCDADCADTWRQFARDYPEAELAAAKKIGDSVIGNTREDGQKVLLLAHFLYEQFHAQEGDPGPDLLQASPLQQFYRLRQSQKEKLWCGNYSAMIAYFSWAQGIPSRVIGIMKDGDQHILNECYLASAGRWVMVDLTADQLLVSDAQGRMLDFQEARTLLGKGEALTAITSAGTARAVRDSTPVAARYYLAKAPHFYFHRIDNPSAYRFGEKLKRYVLPVSWYDIYETEDRSNGPFWLKSGLLGALLLSIFVFCIRQTKFKL